MPVPLTFLSAIKSCQLRGRIIIEFIFVRKVRTTTYNSTIESESFLLCHLAYNLYFLHLHVIFRLDCEDQDSGVNGELDYTISGGNVPPLFDINSRTGKFRISGSGRFRISGGNMPPLFDINSRTGKFTGQ